MGLAGWLDGWLYRHPFTGASARRYTRHERPAFGDLDARLLARWREDLAGARVIVDLGAGPGTVGGVLRAGLPGATVIDVEPSPDFAPTACRVRARAEALPFPDGSIDAAVSVSAIRHVRDRGAALAELRRVVRPGGVAWIVELDPEASRARVRAHARALRRRWLGAAFGPLVVGTAPTAAWITAEAMRAGWRHVRKEDDPIQPVYLLRLS